MSSIFKLAVIIPTMTESLAHSILNSIMENSIKPDTIVMIDNTECGLSNVHKYNPIPILIRKKTALCVNESWNVGIQYAASTHEFVSILNDDILLGKDFFKKILLGFEKKDKAHVICPQTTTDELNFFQLKELKKKSLFVLMKKREGWAMNWRSSMLKSLPKIPSDRIATFFGDDWLWKYSHDIGAIWIKDLSNIIYHHVGGSLAQTELRGVLEQERAEILKMWGFV